MSMNEKKRAKVPLKVNIFEVAQRSNSQLMPLFAYAGPGDIIVACSSRRSGPNEDLGYFQHQNTVDEILVGFGGVGRIRTGAVSVGAKLHGVGGVTGSAEDNYTVNAIAQRQLEQGAQPEVMIFPCAACGQEVFRHEFDGSPARPDGSDNRRYPPIPTVAGSVDAVEIYNGDVTVRTCRLCGHVNDPFPIEHWGWDKYIARSRIAEDSRHQLDAAAT